MIPIFIFRLYPWALQQPMPCGPGIHWDATDRDGNERTYFLKKNMLPSSSLEEFQYLMYISHHDPRFKNDNGEPYPMMHAYNREQKKIAGYKVDGYVETPAKIYLLEYNGCKWHKPCPISGCKQI